MSPVIAEIESTFAAAGARGRLHARELPPRGAAPSDATPAIAELGVRAETPVAVASVIKIVIALGFARQVAAGTLDPRERVEVPTELRLGGSGIAGFKDTPRCSLRDLALQMLTISDNAATDIVLARVGRPAIDQMLSELGLTETHVRNDMTGTHRRVAAELGFPNADDLDARLAAADPAAVRALAWLQPASANASTPREITALLAAIWSDTAGQPEACAWVRDALSQQVHSRFAAAFGPEFRIASKTGTIPGICNEAGVVERSDGRRWAVAVFTLDGSLAERDPALEAAVGRVARLAVDHLSTA